MALTPNGYPVGPRKRDLVAAGVQFPDGVRIGPVWRVLRHSAEQWHVWVEPLIDGHCWGGAVRQITGGYGYSNHASYTAIDCNAPEHPYGVSGTFSSRQRSNLRSIADEINDVIRWGEFYDNPDGMHAEIDASPESVQRAASKIRARNKSGVWLVLTGRIDRPTRRAIRRVLNLPIKATLGRKLRGRLRVAVGCKRTRLNRFDADFYEGLRKWCNQRLEKPWQLGKGAPRTDIVRAYQVVLTRKQASQ